MKRRHSGSDYQRVTRHAEKAFIVLIKKANEMILNRWPPGEERDDQEHKLWNRVGWMLGKTCCNAFDNLQKGAEEESKLKRRSTHGGRMAAQPQDAGNVSSLRISLLQWRGV